MFDLIRENHHFISVFIGVIGGLVSVLVGILSAKQSIRNIKRAQSAQEAESITAISQSTILLLKPLEEKITSLETELKSTEAELKTLEEEVDSLRKRNKKCMEAIYRLIHQIKSLGHEPVYVPEECGGDSDNNDT